MITPLHQLAELYGIQISYNDMLGRPQNASTDALLAVLKALGAPVNTLRDVPEAIGSFRERQWRQTLEPVTVVKPDQKPQIDVRFNLKSPGSRIVFTLYLENGEKQSITKPLDSLTIIDQVQTDSASYLKTRWYWPEEIAPGYHKLAVEIDNSRGESMIIACPSISTLGRHFEKNWGIFLPLYALHSDSSWGAGDFTDLGKLMSWVSGLGGRLAGTLPLLASFFDGIYGPGPYMPASRLFWNEFYLDVKATAEIISCQKARDIINSSNFQNDLKDLRSTSSVDYSRQLALKRKVLEELADYFFSEKPKGFAVFMDYVKSNPLLEDYARFRACGEKMGIDTALWMENAQKRNLSVEDYDQTNFQYHLYVQWQAQQQVDSLARQARESQTDLYLDMPVGVHPHSYDVWRYKEVFAQGASVGAPPDPVFTSGQGWSFPPLHPENIRKQGYGYWIEGLRQQLRVASLLRIDHVMGFHRLFWIPQGMENSQGVYVNYHPEEFYAILAVESQRHNASIVGEDLGMVPPEVRPAMEEYGISRMFVGQYELTVEAQVAGIPAKSMASLNTHDMFPFAAFWEGIDIAERQKLGLIDADTADKELRERSSVKAVLVKLLRIETPENQPTPDAAIVLKAALNFLAASPARNLLVNLEDLWLETEPQNIPGTTRGQNWSRKTRFSFEEFGQSVPVLEILKKLDQLRKTGG